MKSPRILILAGLVFLSTGCGTGPPYGEDVSVVLLLVDALRADHLGCYGYSHDTTPAIDRLCRRGVSFRNAITASGWTQPAVASLFTGLNPLQHGVMRWPRKQKDQLQITIFPESLDTLAERLQRAGFRTGAFVANPYLEGMIGFGQGFETYHVGDKTGTEIQDEFLDWLDTESPERFFAYLHYMETHWPYSEGLAHLDRFAPQATAIDFETVDWKALHRRMEDEPEALSEDELLQLVALYDGAVRSADDQIGELLQELEDRNLTDRLLVILTADHGEEFREHGRFGHIRTLFDTLLRVPLIVAFPDRWQQGLVVRQQVRLVDVMPTILDAGGAGVPEGLLGCSLLPMIRGDGTDPEFSPYAFSEFMWSDTYLRHSVRTNEFKLIRTFNRGSGSEGLGREVPPAALTSFLVEDRLRDFKVTRGLYDLSRDPGEVFNLFRLPQPPPVAEQLEEVLDDWLRAHAEQFDANEPETLELRGEILERLEGLGYLQ